VICARCNRILLRPPVVRGGMSFGPKCAAAVGGAAPRRARRDAAAPAFDARQRDLFGEARA